MVFHELIKCVPSSYILTLFLFLPLDFSNYCLVGFSELVLMPRLLGVELVVLIPPPFPLDLSAKKYKFPTSSLEYSHQVPVQSITHRANIIKKCGLFQFEEDATTTLWHVSSPLNLAPTTRPLPKFKENPPRFLGNNTVTMNEHLVAFSNACHNIGANDNDSCMCLFVNSLEGKVAVDFFDLPPKIISTWEELVYWFKSTYGKFKIPAEQLHEYNNIAYKDGETIKSFSLCFTKLYNQILELIFPQNQVVFMHYYNSLTSPYHHRLEEKAIDNLGSTLHTCLEYEEQLERTGLPKGDSIKQTDMSALLKLVQDMNN